MYLVLQEKNLKSGNQNQNINPKIVIKNNNDTSLVAINTVFVYVLRYILICCLHCNYYFKKRIKNKL